MLDSFRRHPSFRVLSEYVDLGEEQPDWRDVRVHLRDCTRCRDDVAWLQRLGEEARKLGPHQPPEGTLERILERRRAGDRVILPTEGPVESDDERSAPGSMWLLVLAAGTALGLSAVTLLAPEATAGDNNLSFEPRQPEAGDVLEVRYRPTMGLAGADSLRLRALFRGVGQGRGDPELPGGRREAILRPDEDGLYVGTIEIPAVAAYGQLAVEDMEATIVDSNNGHLWEVLTHADGGVRYEALRQRLIAATGDDVRRVLETTRRMADEFSGRPEAWYYRLAAERQFVDAGALDSLLAFHRGVLDRLQVDVQAADLSPADIGYVASYASVLGDEAAAEYWVNALERRAPRHPGLLRLRAYEVLASGLAPTTTLTRIDSLWARSDHGDVDVAHIALDRAMAAGAASRARTWARRLAELRPSARISVGRRLGTSSATRTEAIRHLREAADDLRDSGAGRPLRENAESWRRLRDAELGDVLLELGRALLAGSSRDAVRDALQEALELEPDIVDAASLAELALTVGDSVSAMQLLGVAAADPLADDSIFRRGQALAAAAGFPPGYWAELLFARRDSLARALLEHAAYRVLRPEVTVLTASGAVRPLRELSDGRPTLLAVRAVHSHASVRKSLDDLKDIHATAERGGHRLVALLVPWKGYSPDPFPSDEVPFPVAHDGGSDVADALGIWNMTAYVVLDAEGVFRGKFADARDALRLMSFFPTASITA